MTVGVWKCAGILNSREDMWCASKTRRQMAVKRGKKKKENKNTMLHIHDCKTLK